MNTYHIIGRLAKLGQRDRYINQQIEAKCESGALDLFEVEGWDWIKAPAIRLVSEAEIMERAGVKPLFKLPPKVNG